MGCRELQSAMGEEGSNLTPMIRPGVLLPGAPRPCRAGFEGTLLTLPISFWLEILGKGKWKIKCLKYNAVESSWGRAYPIPLRELG